jgi:hypothetical protein
VKKNERDDRSFEDDVNVRPVDLGEMDREEVEAD